jgi:bifunctional UDP-N-acetylglucosamine pyrophosphorylase/glucosamine-1-phosphate N-acetyltransferase
MSGPIYHAVDLPLGPVTPARWTAIIPAAGKGSRLGSNAPKILYPVLGRPILSWLLDALAPVCGSVILVLSPEGQPVVEPALKEVGIRTKIVIQERPTGMADAVQRAEAEVATQHVLIVWGDQVTLRAETIQKCAGLHEGRGNATLTLPTVMMSQPYIDVERGLDERIVRVRQAREREVERAVGENDCGLFLFAAKAMFDVLRTSRGGRGQQTGEANLLQLLPLFEQGPGSVATVRLSDAEETLGVNSPGDAAAAAAILARRGRVQG